MTPEFLLKLMLRDKIPSHWRIQPEERICIEFADRMRVATLSGSYRGVWGHIPNEGKRHPVIAIVLKAMGLIPGSADHYFLWHGGGMVIEFKAAKGALSGNQKLFRDWCEWAGVRHAVCRSADEAIDALKSAGALT